ncbi:3-hydroxybutyryl-CoA dehydrogenase [Clostridia bacterium]|nr:3-hydroxybutyryl-CoA dehydrogenase [Clostridia bacterium]
MLSSKTIFVVGSGSMGAGIAQVAAVSGFQVCLNDLTQAQVEKAKDRIDKNLDKLAAKEKLTEDPDVIRQRLSYTDSYEKAAEADIVIEAIYENLEAKKEIFRTLAPLVREDTILASNTSSLSLTALAAGIPHPERFIGLHFFYPVPVMKLLEIVVSLYTSPETIAFGKELGNLLGKEVVVAKDSPGFIVNRALVMMLNEAIFLYEEGVGTAEDIDKAMMLGCNHPIGPLSLADMLGLDIVGAVMETFYKGFADSKYRPAPLLRKMTEAGLLGVKTRRGFYQYDETGKKI